MRYARRGGLFLMLPLLLLSALGCGKSYKIAPVAGRVTLDNKPLANAAVSFYPTGVKDAPYASGTTDGQGNYKLEVLAGRSREDGAVVGEHRVEISISSKTLGRKIDPAKMKRGQDLLPAKYNTDTKLTCTVPPEGKADANFDLKSK
jgi:hypothetical protein